jgi:NADH-quinone oxidoreductase subunit L
MDANTRSHLHETPAVVWAPLVMLAIPSAVIGWYTVGPVLFGDFFGDAIRVTAAHDVVGQRLAEGWHGSVGLLTHAWKTPVFWLAASGVVTAWFLYLRRPDIPATLRDKLSGVYTLLDRKYYFDDLWIKGFAAGGRSLGQFLWKKGDELVIDGLLVNGTAKSVGRLANVVRQIQTGYIYTYAFAMIIGLTALLVWLVWLR